MRKKCTDQVSIFDLFSNHEIGKELKAMSERIDRHRQMLDWVVMDLHLRDVYDTGRQGLPAESVLRCALLKQYRQLSYQELAFHLSDSASFQAFFPSARSSVSQEVGFTKHHQSPSGRDLGTDQSLFAGGWQTRAGGAGEQGTH